MYELESAIVDELNTSDDVKFSLSDRRRASLAVLEKQGVIDYAKVHEVNGKQQLLVVLVKNFATTDFDWAGALGKMEHQLRSKLNDQPIGTRYSWTRGRYLDNHELVADIGNKWGNTSGEDHQVTAIADALLNATIKKGSSKKVAQLLTSGDMTDDDQMAYRFTQYVNSQPTVIFPKKLWRSLGLSEKMRKAGIKAVFPEAGSDLIALSRAEFEQVALQDGWTVTDNKADAELMSKPIKPYAGPAKSAAAQNLENKTALDNRFNSMISNEPNIRLIDLLLSGKELRDANAYYNDDSMRPEVTSMIADGELSIKQRNRLEDIRAEIVNDINQKKSMAASAVANVTASPLDAATAARRELAKQNLGILNKKVILIAPRSNYFIIKSVAGQALPMY